MKTTKKYIEDLINKTFKQANAGKFEIGDDDNGLWIFYVQFSNNLSKSINQGTPTVVVRNKDVFISAVEKYLSTARKFYVQDKAYFELTDSAFDEKLIMDLFVNATNFDLDNIEKFIKQRMQILLDSSVKCEQTIVGQYLDCDIVIKISKNRSNLEGPYKFDILFKKEDEQFNLPSVTFGRVDDTVSVYSVQGEKTKQETKLAKQLDRHFRKANKAVDMNDEILSKVSTNALVSLVVFFSWCQQNGVKQVDAYNYMPIRYNSNLNAGNLKAKDEVSKQQFEEMHDRNQFNISNKFLYTIIRYAHHFNQQFEFDDVCEKLIMKLDPLQLNNLDDNILVDICNSILNNENLVSL